MRTIIRSPNILIWLMCLTLFPQAALAVSPNEFIEEAVNLLVDRLDDHRDELVDDKEVLHAIIDDVILPRFDRRFAAGQVLARHWRNASKEQRDRFIDAFYTTLLHQYADGILEFGHERVEILPFRGDDTKKLVTVKTIMRLTDGTKVPVNYTLVNREDGWRMFDVTIEGVSYVRTFRVEFDSEIRATGLDPVIERLEAEAAGDGE